VAVSCLGLFAAFLFVICLHFLKKASRLRFLDWDITTITLGDYSVEYTIDKEGYEWFLENVYNP